MLHDDTSQTTIWSDGGVAARASVDGITTTLDAARYQATTGGTADQAKGGTEYPGEQSSAGFNMSDNILTARCAGHALRVRSQIAHVDHDSGWNKEIVGELVNMNWTQLYYRRTIKKKKKQSDVRDLLWLQMIGWQVTHSVEAGAVDELADIRPDNILRLQTQEEEEEE